MPVLGRLVDAMRCHLIAWYTGAMANRAPFEIDEWYHCFNRGVEKRKVFDGELDANRFLMLLYLANDTGSIELFSDRKPQLEKVFNESRKHQIVSIGAYCLMPNHFHLLLKETEEGGISAFMRKVGVAYTMYFNAKNERIGNLFLKPFRSRHVATDRYFQRVLQYIHCNPAELFESGWKSGKVRNIGVLEKKLLKYPYSSLRSYAKKNKDPILSKDGFEIAENFSFSKVLHEAQVYYSEVGDGFK